MKVVAIIQARMGSSRLPGKVLMDICGKTMLERVVDRARACGQINETVVATSDLPVDDALASFCAAASIPVFRGSEHDVLSRYALAAAAYNADAIVRITADCPLLDPRVTGSVVAAFLNAGGADGASNVIRRTYPRGLDTEVVSRSCLDRINRIAVEQADREHVTRHIYRNASLYTMVSVEDIKDSSAYRWTVDEEPDLALVRAIYARLDNPVAIFGLDEMIRLLQSQPELAGINGSIRQKPI